MPTNEELMEAAKLLKEYCGSQPEDCGDCVFYKEHCDDAGCVLMNGVPADWIISQPKRWTQEDIALAKLLRNAGVERLFKSSSGEVCWIDKEADTPSRLPNDTFRGINPSEVVFIDDILREDE